MTDEQINEIVQMDEAIRNCYLNAIERTDREREYRQEQRNIAKWLEELKRYKELECVRSQKWIDVDEKLPKEKMNCLVHYVHSYSNNDGFYAIGIAFYNGVSFQFDNISYRITHWMPLPESPNPQ